MENYNRQVTTKNEYTGYPADMVTLLKWVAGHKYEPTEGVRLSNETLLCFPLDCTVEGKDHKVKSKIFGPFGQILAKFSSL